MDSVKAKVNDLLTSKSGKGKTVLVTGGTGYVAAHVLNSFLSRGYNVRTTVRNEASAEKVRKSHSKYLDQLSFAIVKDVALPGGHDEAVKDVDGVIHTASPFVTKVEDNVRDLLDPAIKGTTEVLKSIQKNNPKVKRVVLTSSFAAVGDFTKGTRPGYTYSEKDWNPVTLEIASNPETDGTTAYCASKTFAEKAAFDFVKENNVNFSVASILPPMIYGPAAHTVEGLDHLNTSSADLYRLINGSEKTVPEDAFYAWVDVRDVGEAHLLAYEAPKAGGQRYFTTAGNYTYQQIVDIIRRDFPEKRSVVPEGTPGAPLPDVYRLDNSKIQNELGIKFRTLETSIHDAIAEFVELEKKASKA